MPFSQTFNINVSTPSPASGTASSFLKFPTVGEGARIASVFASSYRGPGRVQFFLEAFHVASGQSWRVTEPFNVSADTYDPRSQPGRLREDWRSYAASGAVAPHPLPFQRVQPVYADVLNSSFVLWVTPDAATRANQQGASVVPDYIRARWEAFGPVSATLAFATELDTYP